MQFHCSIVLMLERERENIKYPFQHGSISLSLMVRTKTYRTRKSRYETAQIQRNLLLYYMISICIYIIHTTFTLKAQKYTTFGAWQAEACQKCGDYLLPDSLFCRRCGHKVQAVGAEPPAVPLEGTSQDGLQFLCAEAWNFF